MNVPPAGRRGAGHTALIVCTALVTVVYLALVILKGPGPTPVILTFAWGIAAIPISRLAHRLAGGRPVYRTAEFILVLSLVLFFFGAAFESPILTFALVIAGPPIITCYVAYRVMRRVWLARPPGENRTERELVLEFGVLAALAIGIVAALAPDFRFSERRYRERRLEFASNHTGCYAMQVGFARPAWMPEPDVGRWPNFPIRLDSITGEGMRYADSTEQYRFREFERNNLIVRPASTVAAYWVPLSADSVEVRWSTGHHGRRMYLERTADGYEGHIETFTDMRVFADPSARVRARPVSCDSVPRDSIRLG